MTNVAVVGVDIRRLHTHRAGRGVQQLYLLLNLAVNLKLHENQLYSKYKSYADFLLPTMIA